MAASCVGVAVFAVTMASKSADCSIVNLRRPRLDSDLSGLGSFLCSMSFILHDN